MNEETSSFFELVNARRGHFLLESGHHSELWLDLDALFAEPRRIKPLIMNLANAIRAHDVSVVCGPLLGGAFLAQLIAHELDADFSFTERVMPAHPAGLYQARYQLPPAFVPRLAGKRVAIVDDVMSAGSALRGTYQELNSNGAVTAVAGALLVLGSTGAQFFAERGIAVEAVGREHYDLWLAADCPMCASGIPLEHIATPPS